MGDFRYSSLRHGLIIQTKEQIDKLVIIIVRCKGEVGGMTSRDTRGQRQATDTETVGSL